jgi:hypothetical protein
LGGWRIRLQEVGVFEHGKGVEHGSGLSGAYDHTATILNYDLHVTNSQIDTRPIATAECCHPVVHILVPNCENQNAGAAARGAPKEVGLGRRGVGAGPCRALVAAPGAWGCWRPLAGAGSPRRRTPASLAGIGQR